MDTAPSRARFTCCSSGHIQVRVSNVPPMLWTTTHTSHVSRETRTTVPSSSIGSIEATKRHNGRIILSIVIVALAESAPTHQRTHLWLNNRQQYSASRSHIPGNVSSNRTFQRLNDSAPPKSGPVSQTTNRTSPGSRCWRARTIETNCAEERGFM